MPSINNYLKGFTDGLPGMKDFRHASRLYIDDNYKLMPKQKFLFHVIFDLDDRVAFRKFAQNERDELNKMLKVISKQDRSDLRKAGIKINDSGKRNLKLLSNVNEIEIQ